MPYHFYSSSWSGISVLLCTKFTILSGVSENICPTPKIEVNCCGIIIQNMCSKDIYDTVSFIVIYEN